MKKYILIGLLVTIYLVNSLYGADDQVLKFRNYINYGVNVSWQTKYNLGNDLHIVPGPVVGITTEISIINIGSFSTILLGGLNVGMVNLYFESVFHDYPGNEAIGDVKANFFSIFSDFPVAVKLEYNFTDFSPFLYCGITPKFTIIEWQYANSTIYGEIYSKNTTTSFPNKRLPVYFSLGIGSRLQIENGSLVLFLKYDNFDNFANFEDLFIEPEHIISLMCSFEL